MDLERKLLAYQYYFNHHRAHSSLDGHTPEDFGDRNIVELSNFRWQAHCRGLFQLPVAA